MIWRWLPAPAVLVLLAIALAAGCFATSESEERRREATAMPPHAERGDSATQEVSSSVPQQPSTSDVIVLALDHKLVALPAVGLFWEAEYAREQIAIAEYLEGVWQAQEAERAEAARRAREAVRAPQRASGGVGDCTGFPIPDYVIRRESGGNPMAVNRSSGAFGCAQIMPFWWSGHCAHLDKFTLSGQRECTQIILELQGPSAWSETW